jgi:hypothetical protein
MEKTETTIPLIIIAGSIPLAVSDTKADGLRYITISPVQPNGVDE